LAPDVSSDYPSQKKGKRDRKKPSHKAFKRSRYSTLDSRLCADTLEKAINILREKRKTGTLDQPDNGDRKCE